MKHIKAIMDYYAGKTTGQLGLGFKNFKTGHAYYVAGDTRFPAASTFKVPLLIELFHQVAEGKLTLTDTYTLQKEDIAPGSGLLMSLSPGVSMSILDYARLMMMISDNTATDILFRLVGKENILAMIQAMGLENTRGDLTCRELLFTLIGIPQDATGEEAEALMAGGKLVPNDDLYIKFDIPNAFCSPKDMMTMLSLIYDEAILTPDACRQMRDILAACITNSRIPYHLPQDGTVTVMHKTGTLPHVFNDCGIVVTPTQTYGLTIFYNRIHASDAEKATPHFGDFLLADISKEIYDALHR